MRDLRPLFDPRSVAVVGASADPAKWGHWIAEGALKGADRRDVWLVNRNGGEILGQKAYRSLEDLPGEPELVAIALPAAAFEETVDAALAVGARAIVGITAGLGEADEEGREVERRVVERVRAAGAVLLGPNCLGVVDAATSLDLGMNEFAPGALGLLSQSGNLALEVSALASDYGLGISRFASLGNQADLEAADLVGALAEDEHTRVIGVYCEDFRDGRAFVRAAAAATDGGTPVVLLAAGGSEAGARAAASHTGSLASDSAAVDAACRAAGVFRVRTPKELVDRALAALAPHRPRGRRIVVVGDGGGTGVVAADLATEAGLELPQLSPALEARLKAGDPGVITANPVDLAGVGEQDFWSFERALGTVLDSGEADAVLFTGYFGGYGDMNAEFVEAEVAVARAIAGRARSSGCTLIAQAMYWRSAPVAALRSAGVPAYRDIEAAVGALAELVEVEERPRFDASDPEPRGQRSPVTATWSRASCSRPRGSRSRPRYGPARPKRRSQPRASSGAPSRSRRSGSSTNPTPAASRSGWPATTRSPRPCGTWRPGSFRRATRSRRWSTPPTQSSSSSAAGATVASGRSSSSASAASTRAAARHPGCARARLGGRAGAASAPAPRRGDPARGARPSAGRRPRGGRGCCRALPRRVRAPGDRRDRDQPAARAAIRCDRPRRADRA